MRMKTERRLQNQNKEKEKIPRYTGEERYFIRFYKLF